jgi:hypothetical protein
MEPQMSSPRAYSITDWHRDFARAFAAAVPLESSPTKARGALLAASNDEPEPEDFDRSCIAHQLMGRCTTRMAWLLSERVNSWPPEMTGDCFRKIDLCALVEDFDWDKTPEGEDAWGAVLDAYKAGNEKFEIEVAA